MAPSELATSFHAGSAFGARSLVDEEFNCDSVQEVHARFSDPGSVVDTTAKLFFSYRGVPDGNHTLKVFWDFDNAPQTSEDIDLTGLILPSPQEGLFNIEGTVEHFFNGIEDDTSKTVRIHLSMPDLTGNCATVRHIELKPPVEKEKDPMPDPTPTPGCDPPRATFGRPADEGFADVAPGCCGEGFGVVCPD